MAMGDANHGQAQTPFLDASWHQAWRSLALHEPDALVLQELKQAYSEPQRHYHTLQHLHEALSLLQTVLPQCRQPGEVEIALWFHDAVYDPKAKDNEALSADWAARVLAAQHASEASIARVRELILATQHSAEPQDPDAQLLVDVDLAILAAEPARFAEYENQVRVEYVWVPMPIFEEKRREVLLGFVERDRIYSTEHFHALLESRARANLTKATIPLQN